LSPGTAAVAHPTKPCPAPKPPTQGQRQSFWAPALTTSPYKSSPPTHLISSIHSLSPSQRHNSVVSSAQQLPSLQPAHSWIQRNKQLTLRDWLVRFSALCRSNRTVDTQNGDAEAQCRLPGAPPAHACLRRRCRPHPGLLRRRCHLHHHPQRPGVQERGRCGGLGLRVPRPHITGNTSNPTANAVTPVFARSSRASTLSASPWPASTSPRAASTCPTPTRAPPRS
jgi:hypothetical protein